MAFLTVIQCQRRAKISEANMSAALSRLALISLRVLELEPTGPLIRARLPANPTIAARKQNAPQRNRSQETRSHSAEPEGEDARLRPHAVAVEGDGAVVDGGYGERGEGVWSFGVSG